MSNTPARWKLWRELVLVGIGGISGFGAGIPIWLSYKDVLGTALGWTALGVFWGLAQWVVLDHHLYKG